MHNVRSTYNVGAVLRTADGLGIEKVIFSGYTPYPKLKREERLPYLVEKINKQIDKTALGATNSVSWQRSKQLSKTLSGLKTMGYTIAALEQTKESQDLSKYSPPEKIVLIVGNEIDGVDPTILKLTDITLEIPMFGKKESFNLATAAAIASYHILNFDIKLK